MELGNTVDFAVVPLDENGDVVDDVSLEVEWWSTDEAVFEVEEDGMARATGEGEAYCVVEATGVAKASRFVGRDSAFVTVLK